MLQGPPPSTERTPDPGCPWPRAGAKVMIVTNPCTCPSLPWKPLESTRHADGLPLPDELDEGPWVSNLQD